MTERRFKQVDVFTAVPLMGNPVAVVLDAHGLSDADMQRMAAWTNLSETTFVLPPTDPAADYRVRIFTPRAELPFAGHPTLGTAHAVIEAGLAAPKDGALVQQCAVGLVRVAVEAGGLSFILPAHRFETAPEPAVIVTALGGADVVRSAPRIVNVGPRWVIAELATAALVETLEPDLPALAAYDRAHATTGLTVYAAGGAGDITVRSFAPADGISEDPVCGSGNGAVAAFRLDAGQVSPGEAYLSSQGRQVGRDGRVAVRFGAETIHVGGACVTLIDGILRL
ncbi:MAG: PhzF family phenazine biosynthesis protein [Sphingomonadales bacterium]|nr:PhzF family phenazine biosynthesis protein [Sphingomonadales bacterium]